MTSLPSITGAGRRVGRANPLSLANDRVTTCKVCGFGVFKHQLYRWATNPTGISHTECLEGADDDRS